MTDSFIKVDYTEVGNLDLSIYKEGTVFGIFMDKADSKTLMTMLALENKNLSHVQNYVSFKEFATVEMKQVLTLYVKRTVVSLDDAYYTLDDPKLHGFISKLSYEGIKYVAEHIVEFAEAFKHNKVSEVLNIPKPSKKRK